MRTKVLLSSIKQSERPYYINAQKYENKMIDNFNRIKAPYNQASPKAYEKIFFSCDLHDRSGHNSPDELSSNGGLDMAIDMRDSSPTAQEKTPKVDQGLDKTHKKNFSKTKSFLSAAKEFLPEAELPDHLNMKLKKNTEPHSRESSADQYKFPTPLKDSHKIELGFQRNKNFMEINKNVIQLESSRRYGRQSFRISDMSYVPKIKKVVEIDENQQLMNKSSSSKSIITRTLSINNKLNLQNQEEPLIDLNKTSQKQLKEKLQTKKNQNINKRNLAISSLGVTDLLKGLAIDVIKIAKENDTSFWRKVTKPNFPESNSKAVHSTFGDAIRSDIYSDQNGNIIKRNTTFGQLVNKPDISSNKLKLDPNMISNINKVKLHEQQCKSKASRKFIMDNSYLGQQVLAQIKRPCGDFSKTGEFGNNEIMKVHVNN